MLFYYLEKKISHNLMLVFKILLMKISQKSNMNKIKIWYIFKLQMIVLLNRKIYN